MRSLKSEYKNGSARIDLLAVAPSFGVCDRQSMKLCCSDHRLLRVPEICGILGSLAESFSLQRTKMYFMRSHEVRVEADASPSKVLVVILFLRL